MASLQELESALIKADAAGNADDARVLAGEIRKLKGFSAIKSEGNVQKPPVPFVPSGEKALSSGEEILANPYGRAAVGALKPIVGIGQLALNTLGQGEGINREMQNLKQATGRARDYMGSRGADLADMAGQAGMMALPLGMLSTPATTFGRIGQGALTGAAAGASEPVQAQGNYFGQKALQVGAGAVGGAAVPAGWEGIKAIGRGERNIMQPYVGEWGADRAAGRLLNSVAGEKQPAVVQALENPQNLVPGSFPTAGQAAVPAGSAEFSALQRIAAEKDPSKYGLAGIEGQQNAARLSAVKSVGGTPADIYAADQARTAATAQMREANLVSANTLHGGVKSQGVVAAISRQQNEPGIRASTIVQKVLGDVKDKIAALTDKNGVIDAKDLYTIRKEIGSTIQLHAKDTANWDKRLAASLEGRVQDYIDNAIERGGGYTWKDYLARYSQMSRPIEQMKAGQALEQKLVPALSDEAKQRATVYANALRETAPDIAETFTPRQAHRLGAVKSDLERDATLRSLAGEGMAATKERIGQAIPEAPPSGMFSPIISVTRGLYNRATGKATEKILSDLASNMDNPQAIATMMKKATPFQRQVLVDQLMKYQSVVPAIAQENQ